MREEIKTAIDNSPGSQVILNHDQITDVEIAEIMRYILTVKPATTQFFFKDNQLTDQGAITLAIQLANFPTLEILDVQNNLIDKTGAEAIYQLLKAHPELTLAFAGNRLMDAGIIDTLERYNTRPLRS